MKAKVVFRRVARAEYDDAADWYEQQKPGLGAEFIAEMREVLTRISENPQFYAKVHEDVREGLAHRFPYAVYYREEGKRIIVLGVIHTARDPAVWKARA